MPWDWHLKSIGTSAQSSTWDSSPSSSWISLQSWYLLIVGIQNLQGMWRCTGDENLNIWSIDEAPCFLLPIYWKPKLGIRWFHLSGWCCQLFEQVNFGSISIVWRSDAIPTWNKHRRLGMLILTVAEIVQLNAWDIRRDAMHAPVILFSNLMKMCLGYSDPI